MLPLQVTGLIVRRKGKHLLGPIDLTLAGAGITALIGPNGAGKTTLLRSLHGIERITEGRITWAVPQAEARRHQAYVFQSPILLRRTVAGNLMYPLQLARSGGRSALVALWASRAGLADKLALPAHRLSGGEQQKLALARALITAPQVLFLDEPCANLDGHATGEIETLLREAAGAGTRIVMATHDMGQARRLASDLLFLVNGRIVEQGRTALTSPRSPQLIAFLNGDIVT